MDVTVWTPQRQRRLTSAGPASVRQQSCPKKQQQTNKHNRVHHITHSLKKKKKKVRGEIDGIWLSMGSDRQPRIRRTAHNLTAPVLVPTTANTLPPVNTHLSTFFSHVYVQKGFEAQIRDPICAFPNSPSELLTTDRSGVAPAVTKTKESDLHSRFRLPI